MFPKPFPYESYLITTDVISNYTKPTNKIYGNFYVYYKEHVTLTITHIINNQSRYNLKLVYLLVISASFWKFSDGGVVHEISWKQIKFQRRNGSIITRFRYEMSWGCYLGEGKVRVCKSGFL